MAKWLGDDRTYINGLTKLERILDKQLRLYKEAADRKRSAFSIKVGDYSTEDEIQDAYGWGNISDDERIALLKQLQDKEDISNNLFYTEDAMAFYLSAVLRDLRYERDDLKATLKSKDKNL